MIYNTKMGCVTSSYSQIDKYERCPFSWQLKYIQNIESTVRSKHLEYGLAVHEALEELFSTLYKKNEINKETAVSAFHSCIAQRNIPFDTEAEEIEWILEGVLMLERLFNPHSELEKVMMSSEILGVEMPFEIMFDGVTIIGFIDLVLNTKDGIIVVDHKSGGKVYQRSQLENNLQFPIYAMAIKQLFGELPSMCYYNFTRIHKVQPLLVTEGQIHEAEDRIRKTFKKMSKQKHTPKPCNLCFWCDYSKHKMDVCRYSSHWMPKSIA